MPHFILCFSSLDGKDISDLSKMRADGRAYALSAASLTLLSHLKIDVSQHLEPMNDMLITDGGLGEEPPWRLHFDSEVQTAAPAQMIENYLLMQAVSKRLAESSEVTILAPSRIENLTHQTSGVSGLIENSEITADLLIAADGANSPIRQKAGIVTDGRVYNQSALVTTIAHDLPHDGLLPALCLRQIFWLSSHIG